MTSHKLIVKLFLADGQDPKPADVVPALHGWIQRHAVEDHLLIDVADYAHVHDGPGILLVAHEANFYLDRNEGRPGLTYQRKRPVPGATTFTDRLRQAFAAALQAAALLEAEPALAGQSRFRTDEALLILNDRLLAPNTPETLAAVRPELESFLRDLYGHPASLEHRLDDEKLFEVRIKSPGAPGVTALLDRLTAGARR